MQLQNKKQSRLTLVKSNSSHYKNRKIANNSVSSAKSRKYFKFISKKHIICQNQSKLIFDQKGLQIISNLNDYGFNKNKNKYSLETNQKNSNLKHQKLVTQNAQTKAQDKIKFFKRSRYNHSFRSSRQYHSSDSTIRNNKSITPIKKSFLISNKKKNQPSSPQMTIDTKDYETTIQFLEYQNQYYSGLYANSQQRIEIMKKAAQDERKKFERVRKIYQQKIHQLNANKQACQKNIGHIFSYDNFHKDIVPDQIIPQNSIECSLDDIQKMPRKNSLTDCLKLSSLSINSR